MPFAQQVLSRYLARIKGEKMKSLGNFGGALLLTLSSGILIFSVPARAQTTSPTLTALNNFEQSITLSDVLPAVTPNLPANVMAAITGGALDLRAQTNYNPSANMLTMTFFTVQTGSPTPANLGQINPANIFGSLTFSVDRLYVTSSVVQFVGSVTSGSSTPFGSFLGVPYTLSFTYSGTPAKLTNSIIELGGTLVLLSPAAAGTVNITQPSTGGSGGTGATGVSITVNIAGSASQGTNSFAVEANQINPDASKSTSSNAGALTYSWVVAPNSLSAVIIGSSSAAPLMELSTKGTYQFTLTVTDATGVTNTATITVQYI